MADHLRGSHGGYAEAARLLLHSAARHLMDSDSDGNSTSYGLGDDTNPAGAGNATVSLDGTSDDELETDTTVFWAVNIFLLTLLSAMVAWCCCCKKDWLLNPEARRAESDAIYQETVRRRAQRHKDSKIVTPEQRKQKLLESFMRHGVTMIVAEEHFLDANYMLEKDPDTSSATNTDAAPAKPEKNDIEAGAAPSNDDGEADGGDMDSSRDMSLADSINAAGYLKLPEQSDRQPVPNCCAVCLGEYDVGDHVVWSSNPVCAHAFHEECILEWLIKMQPETPCPCCRQEFTDLEKIRQEKKIIWSGDAFNLRGIAL